MLYACSFLNNRKEWEQWEWIEKNGSFVEAARTNGTEWEIISRESKNDEKGWKEMIRNDIFFFLKESEGMIMIEREWEW